MDGIAKVIIDAFPFLEGLVDFVRVVVTATPAQRQVLATSTFLILAVGAYYVFSQTKVIENPFGGGEEDDSDW